MGQGAHKKANLRAATPRTWCLGGLQQLGTETDFHAFPFVLERAAEKGYAPRCSQENKLGGHHATITIMASRWSSTAWRGPMQNASHFPW